jgi:hypothetical protein
LGQLARTALRAVRRREPVAAHSGRVKAVDGPLVLEGA